MWFWSIVFLTLVVLAIVVPLRARTHDDRLWSIAERTPECCFINVLVKSRSNSMLQGTRRKPARS
jgi:hypothetical protein